MKKLLRYLLPVFLVFLGCYLWIKQDYPQTTSNLIYNGSILTMEASQPQVEAVFVENGVIKAVGNYQDLKSLMDNETEVLDLEGKTLLPGFIDSHSHVVGSSFLHGMVDLSGFTHSSPEDVWHHLASTIDEFNPGEWIVCKGFDPVLVEGLVPPHISYLDSIAPDNPLLIISQSLHSHWANSLAFQKVGIDKKTPDPSGSSYYEKDEEGELTGFIAEQEAFLPFRLKLVETGRETLLQNIVEVMKEYARFGNTTVATLGISSNDPQVVTLYEHLSTQSPSLLGQALSKIGVLPTRKPGVRHFAYIRHDAINLLPESVDNGDDFFKILGVKFWYDGSPYTGSMYVEEPYLNSTLTQEGFLIPKDYRGKALITKPELKSYVEEYRSQGWQIAIHAQGDLAIKEILQVMEEISDEPQAGENRTRLEHCILLDTSSIPVMKKLAITPNFHINHLYYYGKALRDEIIGKARAQQMLPIASAADAGLKYAMHADKPMFESDPISLISTAVNRLTKEGDSLGIHQAISVEQALLGMTLNAAWQLKMEDKIGSIKVGKYGDFVVLDQNPLGIEPEKLRNIKVLQTLVHGNTVFKHPG